MNPTFKNLIALNPEFYEIQILAIFLVSQAFFTAYAPRINSYNQKLRGQKKFSNYKHNILYDLIDAYRGSEAGVKLGDNHIPRAWVEDMVEQLKASGQLTPQMVQEFPEFLNSVYNRATPEIVQSIQGDAFDTWFDVTLVEDYAKAIQSAKTAVSPDEAKSQLDDLMSMRTSNRVRAMDFGQSMMVQGNDLPVIVSSLSSLNSAIGGGFRKGESTLVAAMTGGGKTVLATQLAFDFAFSDTNVLLVTTEQRPNELTPRILSNYLRIPFSEFQMPGEGTVLPKHIMRTPRYMENIAKMTSIMNKNLRFLDWSDGEGKSVEEHLDADLDAIVNDPEDPFAVDVVIFDWIGGALSKSTSREIREIYLRASTHLHELAKRRDVCVVMFAQLNKSQAERKLTCISSMLAECKSMPDQATNAIYISSVRPAPGEGDFGDSYSDIQQFTVDKARKGPGGWFKVKREFKYQKFLELRGATGSQGSNNTIGG